MDLEEILFRKHARMQEYDREVRLLKSERDALDKELKAYDRFKLPFTFPLNYLQVTYSDGFSDEVIEATR